MSHYGQSKLSRQARNWKNTMNEPDKHPRGKALDTLVETMRVSCDGGGGVGGHPKVYYDLDENGEAWCFYCSRHFILKGSKADH